MEKKMTFREKLIILRKNKGLTQDDFAKAVGVSRQAVYKWESGASYPEVPKLLEIKAFYGISLDELFDEAFEIAAPEKKRRSAEKKDAVTEKPTPTEIKEEKISKEEAPAAASAEKEEKAADEDRKVGFFGRLFGRK